MDKDKGEELLIEEESSNDDLKWNLKLIKAKTQLKRKLKRRRNKPGIGNGKNFKLKISHFIFGVILIWLIALTWILGSFKKNMEKEVELLKLNTSSNKL